MKFEFSDDYCRKFADLAELHFKIRLFPEERVEFSGRFVRFIRDGFDDIREDYDNYLSGARGYIDLLIDSEELKKFAKHLIFVNSVNRVDCEFIELTQEWNPHYAAKWWEKRIPKFAKKDYVESWEPESSELGIIINIIE